MNSRQFDYQQFDRMNIQNSSEPIGRTRWERLKISLKKNVIKFGSMVISGIKNIAEWVIRCYKNMRHTSTRNCEGLDAEGLNAEAEAEGLGLFTYSENGDFQENEETTNLI